MKRKLKWLVLVLVILVVGLGTAFFLWPRDKITVDSYKMMRLGMTEKEVEVIVGGPGISREEYLNRMTTLEVNLGKFPFVYDGSVLVEPEWDGKGGTFTVYWLGERGLIAIQNDDESQVSRKYFQRWHPADPNLIDRLRDWLGW